MSVCERESVCVLLNGISAFLNCVSGIVSLSGGALFFNAYMHCTDNIYFLFISFCFQALDSFPCFIKNAHSMICSYFLLIPTQSALAYSLYIVQVFHFNFVHLLIYLYRRVLFLSRSLSLLLACFIMKISCS